MYDIPYYFEPTFTFMGFLDHQMDVRPHVVVGRSLVAVTHLASMARRQNIGKRHFGFTKDKRESDMALFFKIREKKRGNLHERKTF